MLVLPSPSPRTPQPTAGEGAFQTVAAAAITQLRSQTMTLQITGHHLEITPAIHDYVTGKLERITRHFDNVIGVNVILSVDKLKQKAEVTVHLSGKDVHVEAIEEDLYAAVDCLVDKLDRKIQQHKQKLQDHHRGEKPSHAVNQ
jgi:putative sigma-54 modulation protein